jgi:hypothetical protein
VIDQVDDNAVISMEGKPASDDPADVAPLTELHDEAQASAPPEQGSYSGRRHDEAHEAATSWDALRSKSAVNTPTTPNGSRRYPAALRP